MIRGECRLWVDLTKKLRSQGVVMSEQHHESGFAVDLDQLSIDVGLLSGSLLVAFAGDDMSGDGSLH